MKLGNASAVRGMHEGLGRNLLGFGTGPSGAPSFVGALDDYTANLHATWSVARRLLSSYTGALIRVRESSGNTEADIGFDADGKLDEAALAAHVGANSGFVTKVYDQCGGGRDLVQATAGSQPRIVNAGTIQRFNSGVAPAMLGVTAGGQGMATAAFTALTGTDYTAVGVQRVATVDPGNRVGVPGGTSTASSDAGADGWVTAYILAVTGAPTSFDGSNRATLAAAVPYALALASTTRTTGHVMRTAAASNTAAFTPSAKSIQHWLVWMQSVSILASSANAEWCEGAAWTADRDSDMAAVLAEMNTFYGL